jgi:hypothetical protein
MSGKKGRKQEGKIEKGEKNEPLPFFPNSNPIVFHPVLLTDATLTAWNLQAILTDEISSRNPRTC